jgi:hypothetical protein
MVRMNELRLIGSLHRDLAEEEGKEELTVKKVVGVVMIMIC